MPVHSLTAGRRTADRTDRTPFCKPVNLYVPSPLRLKPGMAEKLLALPLYQGTDSADLVEYAQAKVSTIESDRATAIAVLMGARGPEAL